MNASDFESCGYDPAGNRTSLRKRDGRTLTFTFDARDRMIAKLIPAGCAPIQAGPCPPASATRSVYFGYDLRGLQLFARFDSPTGDGVTNAYDGFGRLTASTTSIGGLGGTVSSQYDADGNRTRVTHPDGAHFDSVYDAADWLQHTDMTGPGGGGSARILTMSYDPLGRRTTLNPASSQIAYQYDAVSRLQVQTQHFAGSVGDMTDTLGYNPASQIVSEARSNDAFVYAGSTVVTRGYSVNGLNQYTAVGSASPAYDADGNLISDGASTYGYDAENRLISAAGATTASLVYDPLGRLWQTSGAQAGSTTAFLHDGDEIAAEYNASGAILRRYMWGPGVDEPIVEDEGGALACGSPQAPTTFVLHADHQGSVIARADCWGNRVGVNAYDEYGVPAAANAGRFGYTGQAWIPELGLWYYKARFYSPALGRFLQVDPVGYADQINLYAYAGNDPVNGRDPSGDISWADAVDIAGDVVQVGSDILGAGEVAATEGAAALGPAEFTVAEGNALGEELHGAAAGMWATERARARPSDFTRAVKARVRSEEPSCASCGRPTTSGKADQKGRSPAGDRSEMHHKQPAAGGGSS